MKNKAKAAGLLISGIGAALFSTSSLAPLPTLLLVTGFIVFIVGRLKD